MTIGVDLDGVVVNSVPRWREVFRRAGYPVDDHELPLTHATPELAELCDRHEIEMLIVPPPIDGAVEALRTLKRQKFNVVAVTSRSPRLRRLTEAWLDYWDIPIDEMFFLEGESKVPTIRAQGISVFVEDTRRRVLLEFPKQHENELGIGHVLLTRAGQELARVCGSRPVEGFFEYVYSMWEKGTSIAAVTLEE